MAKRKGGWHIAIDRAGIRAGSAAIDAGFIAILDAVGAGGAGRAGGTATIHASLVAILDAVVASQAGRAGAATIHAGLAAVLDAVGTSRPATQAHAEVGRFGRSKGAAGGEGVLPSESSVSV